MYRMQISCNICDEILGTWARRNPWSDENIDLAKQMFRCNNCPEMTADDVIVTEIPNELAE